MNRIRLLEKNVAEMIAAGEVVERPASAVKELLENALDAGATAVTLEIKNGGIAFIRVTDNGSGILHEDLRTAFLRHATSKVHTAEDLDSIGTLGFRGEALASIAAVSRVELITRTAEELSGSRIALAGGTVTEEGDAGCPQGTTIIVRELFYNTPARMKFLKKDVSEGNAVAAVAERIALSHPEVSVKFIRDGRVELHTPGDGRLLSAVHAALGRDFAAGLTAVDYTLNGVKVTGYVAKPVNARPNRNFQFVFLNGRLIKSKTACAALEEAYKGSIMVGRFPGCVLCLALSPSLVDVNVHPAKIEVRFANERQVFDAVYYGVKNALEGLTERPEFSLRQKAAVQAKAVSFAPRVPAAEREAKQLTVALPNGAVRTQEEPDAVLGSSAHPYYEPVQARPARQQAAPEKTVQQQPGEKNAESPLPISPEIPAAFAEHIQFPATEPEKSVSAPENAPEAAEEPVLKPASAKAEPVYRVIGQCFDTYFLVETEGELLLIDKHAAHERMLYEELKHLGGACAQQLLEPLAVDFTREEYRVLLDHAALLLDAGFEIGDLGGRTVIVRAAPTYLMRGEIEATLSEMAGYLISNKKDLTPVKLDSLYHSVACRAAIKGGDKTGRDEEEKLVRRVLAFDDIRYCPHGRPVVMSIPRGDIEKQFGRA